MSTEQRRLFWLVLVAVALIIAGLLWSSTQSRADSSMGSFSLPPSFTSPAPQGNAASRVGGFRSRLSRQPEVSKLRRIIGQRLNGKSKAASTLVGVLVVGNDEQRVHVIRRQTDDGETVEVAIGNRRDPLTWSATDGVRSSGDTLTEKERLIVERLTLDSPDQFVLAQLRGASYYTVGHNIRPEEAGGSDNYTGPTWDVVRVGEAGSGEGHSQWRLYYLNSETGLIDRITSQEEGETIVAELSAWTQVGAEKVPSRIIWSRRGQVVMQFRLTNFSHGNQQ